MRPNEWFQPPRHPLTLFLVTTLVLALALGWLSWRWLEQDRALESQRIQERLQRVADLVVASLLRNLSEVENQLTTLSALPDTQLVNAVSQPANRLDDDALIVVFHPLRADAYPGNRLLYYPVLPKQNEPQGRVFAAGEAFEFQQKDYVRATVAFRELARSKDPGIRAGALLRLARNLRKARHFTAALDAYDGLAEMGSTPVGGLAAELLARHARCVLLDELEKPRELEREANALYLDLRSGRWQLTQPAYRFYEQAASHWIGSDRDPQMDRHDRDADSLALAAGVDLIWEEWQRSRVGEGRSSGRRSVWFHDRAVLLLWRSTSERLVGLLGGQRYFGEHFGAPLRSLVDRQGAELGLTDAEGHHLLGQDGSGRKRQVVRTIADAQLPWTLEVASRNPGGELAQLATRRRLLLAGLALMAILVLVGSYLIARAVARELEVAQLQSDFVSAVSHEFRTPLASLCQLSELLAEGRVPGEERRQEYYQALTRESARLHRLVEGLLDFGRMEAGGREYRFETLDPTALVRAVTKEFAQEAEERGFQVEINSTDSLPPVRADREALGRALWNLLDNAVKYSPVSKTIWVETACQDNRVAIRVRDQGSGIAPSEQQPIFKKFVRAASAEAAGIKGSGLGLAMVHHIVVAHEGEIRLESQPGVGSTFTILLPAVKE